MADTFANRVKRGMKLLDEVRPGWVEKIDLDRLAMGHADRCVIGQLAGFYEDGLWAFGISSDDEERLGFFGPFIDYDEWKADPATDPSPDLTAAWRKAIKARREVTRG